MNKKKNLSLHAEIERMISSIYISFISCLSVLWKCHQFLVIYREQYSAGSAKMSLISITQVFFIPSSYTSETGRRFKVWSSRRRKDIERNYDLLLLLLITLVIVISLIFVHCIGHRCINESFYKIYIKI